MYRVVGVRGSVRFYRFLKSGGAERRVLLRAEFVRDAVAVLELEGDGVHEVRRGAAEARRREGRAVAVDDVVAERVQVRAVATRAAARSGSRWKRPVNDASVASSPAARPATRIARQAIDIAAGGLCRRLIKNLS